MTETLLVTMLLILLIGTVLQIFLIDEYSFRLAAMAHHRLFTQVAFPGNRPSVPYDTRVVSWNDPEPQVPLVGFFGPFGLTPADLEIRSAERGGYKTMIVGRGTQPDVFAGLAGVADPSAWLGVIDGAFGNLNLADVLRIQAEARRGGRP